MHVRLATSAATFMLSAGLATGLKDPSTGAPVMLDIIGFDACLMSMYEVAALMSPYSRYLLASEVLEPGHGWDYAAPLRGLIQQKNAAGQSLSSFEAKDVGDLVIKGYMNQAAYYETSGLTMAMLDLGVASSALEASMTSMTQYLSNQLQNSPGECHDSAAVSSAACKPPESAQPLQATVSTGVPAVAGPARIMRLHLHSSEVPH